MASAVAVSSTDINVTWTQPEFLNGVLQSYTVTGLLSQHIHACKNHSHLHVLYHSLAHSHRDLQSISHTNHDIHCTVMSPSTMRTVAAESDVLTAVVDTLSPFTEYTVFVVGITEEGGEGESSNIVTVTTLQDGKGVHMLVYTCFPIIFSHVHIIVHNVHIQYASKKVDKSRVRHGSMQ